MKLLRNEPDLFLRNTSTNWGERGQGELFLINEDRMGDGLQLKVHEGALAGVAG